MTSYTAHFSPEAWIRDEAIPIDPEGPQEWDCTEDARKYANYVARLMADADDFDREFGVIDTDDVFKDDPAAPEWVRAHRGPFTIRIRENEPDDIACGQADEEATS